MRRYLLSFAMSLSSSLAFAVSTPSGIVVESEGSSQIKNSSGVVVASTESKAARVIKKDAPFYEGETIVTGPSGKLKIQFAEGKNEVFLGPNTTLVIQKAPFDLRMKRGTRLFLNSGSVDSKVNQKYSGVDGDEFAIETRTLVAGVRGTQFVVEHNTATNVSKVAVSSGVVEIRSMPDLAIKAKLKAGDSIDSAAWVQASAPVAAPVKPSDAPKSKANSLK